MMPSEVRVGSRWAGTEHAEFCVIRVVERDGQVWVHYKKDPDADDPAREYHCYIESFLNRFRSLPDK